MKHILLVFLGGGIGSAIRYAIGNFFNATSKGFPWGTFSVNIIGSLLIGVFMGLALKNSNFSENQTLLLVTGLCGCLLYTSPSPRDEKVSRMPSSA